MAEGQKPQPKVLVDLPAQALGRHQLALVPPGGDDGVNLLPAGKQLQLLLGIAHHHIAAIFVDFVDAMQNIAAIASGVQYDVPPSGLPGQQV